MVAVALAVNQAGNRPHCLKDNPRLNLELRTTPLLAAIGLPWKTTLKLPMDRFQRFTTLRATLHL